VNESKKTGLPFPDCGIIVTNKIPYWKGFPVTSIASRLKLVRWYHWVLVALVLIYLVYVALSYFYLPGKLKRVTETDVAALIGRSISVERIKINPFILSFNIEEVSVADQPERPLVGWQRLLVNFDFWESLFKWEIALDEFSIDRPEINIEMHPDGFNFSDILQRVAAKDTPESSETTPPKETARLALEVDRTAINQGIFRFTDLSGAVPARSDLNDVTIEVHDLYLATGDEHLNPFDLAAKIPGGGDMHLSGQYRIDPFHVDAQITADKVQLSAFSEFVENILPVKIENGLLSFSTRMLAKQEAGFQFQTSQGRLEITSLDLADDVSDPPLLRAEALVVDGLAMDLSKKHLSAENVALDGIVANQWIDTAGKFRYEALLPETNHEAAVEKAPAPETADPWEVTLRNVALRNSALNFSDQNEAITQDHRLSEITLTLENFTLTPDQSTTISFSTLLDEEGRIQADGAFVTTPFSMDLGYRLEGIALSHFSEYLEKAAFLRIDGGSLSMDGNASLGGAGDGSLSASQDLSLTGLRTADTRTGETLLNLEAFDLKNVAVNTGDRMISIASVQLTAPEVFARMSPKKKMNLATLAKPGGGDIPPEKDSDPKETEESSWKFSIQSTGIKNGAVHYSDRSVSPEYTTGIQDLNVEVGTIATDRTQPTAFTLTGDIDRYAPLSVTGTLLPLDRQPGFALTTTLEGLEMPGLSPYSAAFIGNNLKSGKLSLALDYNLKDRKLKGKNNIVAENLYLGEKVPSETAVNAPVALGLALLRDLKGVIDLDVGVSGDLDDPGFSVSGIIAKALLNIIVKAAASPFKLLGALVGSEEELGEIEFAAGLSILTPQNEARLGQLSGALAQRPQLSLAIQGNASKEEDSAALKAQQVLQQAAAARGISTAELQTQGGDTGWWQAPENREVLASLNDTLNLPPVSERALQLQPQKPQLQGEALTTEVFKQVYADLVDAQKIDAARLLSLADARALSIKQQLVDVLGFDHQRVSVTKARETDLTGRTLTLGIDAM